MRLLPCSLLATTLVAALASAPCARATLTIDLEATTLNGFALSGGNTPKNISVSAGDVVTFQVFAWVTGASGNASLEGLQRIAFKLRSSAGGGVFANFDSGVSFLPVFKASGSLPGPATDGDFDTDLDVGAPGTVYTSGNAPTALASAMVTTGTPIADGQSFDLGTVSLTVASVSAGPSVTVSPILLNSGFTPQIGIWQEDGVERRLTTGGTLAAGVPVTLIPVIPAPEPGSTALLALGALGLLGRRRDFSTPRR